MVKRKTAEKRGAARFPFHHPMSYRVTGGPDSPPNEVNSTGEITNLSQGGMAMRIEARTLEEGTVIQAWIPVADPPVILPILAQARWVKEEQPGGYQIGLRFVL